MDIIDLEFSETLELDPRISGGFSSFQDTPLDFNQDIDVELSVNFELIEIDSLDGVVVTPGTPTPIVETGAVVPPGCLEGGPCNPYIVLVNDAGIPINVTGTLVGAVG